MLLACTRSTRLCGAFINVSCSDPDSWHLYSLTLTQKAPPTIQGQRWRAECHPELCKLHSSGLWKPQPGEMPAPWFVQLILCQRGISWDRGGLTFLWILLKLESWSTAAKTKIKFLMTPEHVCFSLVMVQHCWLKILLRSVRCVSSISSPPARPLMTILPAYRSPLRWQQKAFSWLLV